MNGQITHSDAIGIVAVLFWGSTITSLVGFLTDRQLHAILRTHWKVMIACVMMVVLWRIPIDGGFFHGTEYEDSYVYTVAGRQMAEHRHIEPNAGVLRYSITVCGVGSLALCQESDSFPEHLIGYPFVISLFSSEFGYRPSIGSIVNIVCACLADFIIFVLCMIIADDVTVAASAALIFAITPVFAVWGLETSAEPFSNACMSLALWWCLRYAFPRPEQRSPWHQFVTWCAFTTILLFSLTVKRENILLIIALPAIVLLVQCLDKRSQGFSVRRSLWHVLSAALALMFSLQMGIFQTVSSETALLRAYPPTPSELIRLLPVFSRSFFVLPWYGGAVVLVLIGAVVAWRRKELGLFPLLLFVAYLLLYAFHIRSYYEMRSGDTDPRNALRFSMNLMSLWSVLAGLGTAAFIGWFRRNVRWKYHPLRDRWIATTIVAVVLGATYSATSFLREDVVADEFRMRIAPALAAVKIAASDQTTKSYILTFEPLIPQMYAGPEADVFNFEDLSPTVMNEIGFTQNVTAVLYVDEEIHQTTADADRYASQLAYFNQFPRTTLTKTAVSSVVRICLQEGPGGASEKNGEK